MGSNIWDVINSSAGMQSDNRTMSCVCWMKWTRILKILNI